MNNGIYKKYLFFALLILGLGFATKAAQADTHYVSPTGGTNWGASTNISTPANLATAFANAAAGDLVYLRGGTHTGQEQRAVNDGNSGNKITFQAYSGETVNFTGGIALVLNKDYWVINGVNFNNLTANVNGYNPIYINGGYGNEIRNCTFDAGGGTGSLAKIVFIEGSAVHNNDGYNIIDNCTFKNIASLTYPDGSSEVIAIGYGGSASHHNIISNSIFTDFQAYGIIIWGASTYNQVMNCTFDNTNGYGLGISINDNSHSGAAKYNLIDGNVFRNFSKHEAPGTGYWKSAIQLYGDFNTVRRNLFYDFGHKVSGAYWQGGVGIEGMSFQNNLIYNNVFYNIDNAGSVAVAESSRRIIGNKYYNNIYYKNMKHINISGYVKGAQHYWETRGTAQKDQFEADGNKFDYNFMQYIDPDHIIVHWYSGSTILSTIGSMYADLPNTYGNNSGSTNNIQAAAGPGFVDEAGRDFHLTQSSPLIDKGIIVNDPIWGNLSYSGSAPDIGAYEYVSAAPPDTTPPAAPSGVSVQ